MNSFVVFGVAVGLALDAFAAAIVASATMPRASVRHVLRLTFFFGFFQFFMSVFGWVSGVTVAEWISARDHWVAFGILLGLGGKMIASARDGTLAQRDSRNSFRGWPLVLLSLATSIDALAVGFSLAALRQSIWYPSVIIGLVAAVLTAVGAGAGRWLGKIFGQEIEFVGGAFLVAVGISVLAQHLGWA